MSAETFSLDTNILVYALDSAAGVRHALAAEIVARAATCDCRLTLQSLSEFYGVVPRKGIVPKAEAAAQVEDWLLLFPALAPTRRPSAPPWPTPSRGARATGMLCWSPRRVRAVAKPCFRKTWPMAGGLAPSPS